MVWPGGREDDALGSEFDGLEAAYLDASRAVLEMTGELAMQGNDPLSHAFEVCDEDGLILLELPFAEIRRAPLHRPLTAVDLANRLQRAIELQQRHQSLNLALKSGVGQAMETLRAIRSQLQSL